MSVTIDATPVTLLQNTFSVDSRIEERSTASFTVIDKTAAATYQRGQAVLMYDPDDTLVFGGVIDSVQVVRLTGGGGRLHDISCADYHYLADKRLVAQSYTSKTAGYIVDDIYDKYLAPEGVTIGTISTGPTIVEAVFAYRRVSDCLDALAEKANFIWYIDETKKLYFVARTATAAPWAFTSTDAIAPPKMVSGNLQYRNRQYVRASATTDEQTETFTGDGTTVSFTVGYPLASEPTITVDSVSKTVGIKGLETGKDAYWNKGDAVIAFSSAPANGTAVVIVYSGTFPAIVMSESTAGIADRLSVEGGGTGYVEDISEEAAATSLDSAREAADAKITKFCDDSRRFQFITEESGLAPGQLLTVTYALFGLSAVDMLIESVTLTSDGNHVTYDVTAIEGPEVGSWAKFFKQAAAQSAMTIGENDVLIILHSDSEAWGWTEAVTETVYACSVPANSGLYPAASGLYPC